MSDVCRCTCDHLCVAAEGGALVFLLRPDKGSVPALLVWGRPPLTEDYHGQLCVSEGASESALPRLLLSHDPQPRADGSCEGGSEP